MTIGIVLHPYGEKMPGGLPRVIFGWTKALVENDNKNEYIIFLKNKPKTPPDLPGKNWKLEILGGGILWLTRLRRLTQADAYIFNTPVLPPFFKQKSILIVYDFPYKRLPPRDFFDWLRRFFIGWYHGYSMKRADAIIAVSESTKKDIVEFFGIPENKIKVIYHGFLDICSLSKKAVVVPGKFFLFTGTIKERKNVLNLVRAFKKFKKNDTRRFKLLIAGKAEGKYYEEVKEYIEKNNLAENVVFAGHLNDEELSYMYKKSFALVFPSIVEGTGNPILEAMACGVPVITSNIFGPKELGDDAAILIDPYSTDELADAMLKLAADSAFREELIHKGFEQIKKFDWQNAAGETLKLIHRL